MEDFFIKLARKSAVNSELLQKHGSILICDEQTFTGYNHFVCGRNCVAVHAEEDAINNFIAFCRKKYYDDASIRRKLKRSLLITIRVKNNNIRCSAPCRNCIETIRSYGIRQIIYSENGDSNGNGINNGNGNDNGNGNGNGIVNTVLIKKKMRDVENRPSSGYRWRDRTKAQLHLSL